VYLMRDDDGFNRLSIEVKDCFNAFVNLFAGCPFIYIRRFIHALSNLSGTRPTSSDMPSYA
jgi:hypothetical protein